MTLQGSGLPFRLSEPRMADKEALSEERGNVNLLAVDWHLRMKFAQWFLFNAMW